MDSRQPPSHAYSRNGPSQYSRSPFPPASTQSPYHPGPPLSHTPSFPEHHRPPSDPAYYNHQRGYSHEAPSMPASDHSRHGSVSSLPGGRGMLPPNSPQQQGPAPHVYGPMSRPPPLNGPSPSFATSRDLPSLPPLSRTPSAAAMSIQSVLGGPPPASTTSGHYPSPVRATAAPSTVYANGRASPHAGTEYAPFRRPQTPDYPRTFDSRDRINPAASPSGAGAARFSTPEARRYGTPHTYTSRPPSGLAGPFDDRRDSQGRGPASIPQRPSSQPNGYHVAPSRAPERLSVQSDPIFGRRSGESSRDGSDTTLGRRSDSGSHEISRLADGNEEQRFHEGERHARLYEERDLREREAAHYTMRREREQQEREQERVIAERRASFHSDYRQQMPGQPGFGRGTDSREPSSWRGPGYETRPPFDQHPERPPLQSSTGYPATSHYSSAAAPPGGPRLPSASQHGPIPVLPFEASIIDRQRQAQYERLPQQTQQQAYGPTSHPQYQSHDSPPRRQVEEAPPMQQSRSLLGPGELNRRGRASPLPQAVQGAQIQQAGPAGEPHIKNEFGRMFSGIGSGVGGMGVPSPVSANTPGMPFSNPGQLRRENVDGMGQHESPNELGHKIPREASRGGRRKKLMEEDKEDESSTGRATPGGRGKKPKLHHHHSHHHHHHYHGSDNASPSNSNTTPFRNLKSSAISPPPGQDREAQNIPHHHIRTHHHHHAQGSRSAPPQNTIIPYHRPIVRNQAVLDSVSHLSRHHLGHTFYEPLIHPSSTHAPYQSDRRGFTCTPRPLPRFGEHLNCTFTVKVPAIYLAPSTRQDITARRALWGTEIYTDDSDIIAACIHSGWFRGEWAEDIDASLLGLEMDPELGAQDAVRKVSAIKSRVGEEEIWLAPPVKGPMLVPPGRNCHVTILTLPTLERYAATTRWGIRSRDWGASRSGGTETHDGVSFMILSVKWTTGEAAGGGPKGMKRRERLRRETEERRKAFGRSRDRNGHGDVAMEGMDSGSRQSTLVEDGGIIKGVGMKSWWAIRRNDDLDVGDKEKQEGEINGVKVEKAGDDSVDAT